MLLNANASSVKACIERVYRGRGGMLIILVGADRRYMALHGVTWRYMASQESADIRVILRFLHLLGLSRAFTISEAL